MARKKRRQEEEETSYWLSYSDMMAALLLIFILIITFSMKEMKDLADDFEDQLTIVLLQKQEIDNLGKALDNKDILIEQQKTAMEEGNAELSEQKLKLSEQRALLETYMNENAKKDNEIKLRDEELEKTQLLFQQQQQRLDQLIGIKGDVITALKKEFDDTDLKIQIDSQTGAITFDSTILFDFGKSELKNDGKEYLEKFLPHYLNILFSNDFVDYVSEIIIEGHTDPVGEYLDNLKLSQQRALSVAAYCLDGNIRIANMEYFRKIVSANGKSSSNPIYNSDHTINEQASRRVEFKFRLKDEEMIEEMRSILGGDM